MKKSLLPFSLVLALCTQTPAFVLRASAASQSEASSGVNIVIDLVKSGMSEPLVIKTLKAEGKAYRLSTADLVKLQKRACRKPSSKP